jgi:uncharacterized membrane protein
MEPTRTGTRGGIAARISDVGPLDRPADLLTRRSDAWRGRLADAMRGRPLGHALHPALTDLPIGFWTSAVALDLAGGRKHAAAAKRLVGLGVLSAAPTAVAGFADVPALEPAKRRVAVVHAVSNTVALFLFTRSWWARTRGHRGAGIVDGLLASAVATFGGYLGGWMAFGSATAAADAASSQPVSRLAAVR